MNRMIAFMVLILRWHQPFAQLLPERSIGVFGYQTVEPLGFNSNYSGIVDEWGSVPLQVMNLVLSNTSINNRNWHPTRSVLDGQYLLTGQVQIENRSKKVKDDTGVSSDSTQFIFSSNSSSLFGAQLESSGAHNSFVWQVSGQAGSQRLKPIWGEFVPWGQPDYEVLSLYAAAGGEVSESLRISGRIALNQSASLYTHFNHQEKQELYSNDSHRPLAYLIDSVIPPAQVYDELIITLLPVDEPVPFEAAAQIEQSIHAALKVEFNTSNGAWSILLKSNQSRWYQRITQQHADIRLPSGLPNSSLVLTRETKRNAGWDRWQMGYCSSYRETDIEFFSGVRRQYPEWDGPPFISAAVNKRASLGGELLRRFGHAEVTMSGRVSATSKFGLRPAILLNVDFLTKKNIHGFASVGHDWREPSPFEHQWKSMLNADALNSQSGDGVIMFLYDNLQYERATFAQAGLRLDFGKNQLSHFEITAPIGLIHQQWNVDHQGVLYDHFDSPPIYWNWPGYSGILVSHERGVLAGFNADILIRSNKGLWMGANFTLSTSLQQKGGVLENEYLTPKNRSQAHVGFAKSLRGGRDVKLKILAERIGPQLISIDYRPELSRFSMGMGPLVVENDFSDPFVSTRMEFEFGFSQKFGVQIDLTHSFTSWDIRPVTWSHDVVYVPPVGSEQRLIGPLDANFATAYAPIVPTLLGLKMKCFF